METDGHRRSENFEDRGRGGGGRRGGRAGRGLLGLILRRFGLPGILLAGGALVGVYFLAPPSVQRAVFGALLGSSPSGGAASTSSSGSVCEASTSNAQACDFSRVVLASTEDVWSAQFAQGRLPRYAGAAPSAYVDPTLVVFADAVQTDGCGSATSATGPFYCPRDRKLYIDPGFYGVMERELRAPGDFAQAFVIAHEVGHHVQNLMGSMRVGLPGETEEQTSVRVELQADCLSGVWGHTARSSLQISDEDLDEALQAAHAIGDDALGHQDRASFTHGSSAQRIRWFRRGFESGDARQCDTFAVRDHGAL